MLNVLLVDDEPIMKVALQKIIPWEQEGYHIAGTASNGVEALHLAQSLACDIVVTDLKMPEMDGIELIKRLKESAFDGSILVLSNYSDFELVREALVAGAQDYLLKLNIDAESLLKKLADARETLRSNRQHRKREQIMTEQSDTLRVGALMGYLATEGETPPNALLEGYEESCAPLGMCVIAFFASQRQSGFQPTPVSSVADLVKSGFQDVSHTLMLLPDSGEMVCIYPMELLAAQRSTLRNKAEQIARQISMYFNAPVLVLASGPVPSLSALKAEYLRCMEAAAYGFYACPTMVESPEKIRFSPIPESISPGALAKSLVEQFRRGAYDLLPPLLSARLDAFREARVHPAEVKNFFGQTLMQLHEWTFQNTLPDTVLEAAAALQSCRNEKQLLLMAQESFGHLLRYILPPEFALCKTEVRQILLYLHLHYDKQITLDDIAREVRLDRSYICRLFKRETGCNIFTYLNKLKMNAAAALMRGGKEYVKEIAADVGIQDPFYFTRLFKKHFGVSPSDYRKTFESNE